MYSTVFIRRCLMKTISCGKDKVLFVCISKSYERLGTKGRENLFECTRKYWELDKQREERADYVAGVYKGVVEAIYKNSSWQQVGNMKDIKNDPDVAWQCLALLAFGALFAPVFQLNIFEPRKMIHIVCYKDCIICYRK